MSISSHLKNTFIICYDIQENVKRDFKVSPNSKLTLFGPNHLSLIHLSVSTNPFIFVLPGSWIWHRLVFLLPIGDVFHPPLPSLSAAAALLPLAQRVEKVTQQQTKMREVTQLPDSAIQRRKKRSQDCSRICSESSGCCWRKHTREVCPERATCGELTKQQHMEHVQLWRRM